MIHISVDARPIRGLQRSLSDFAAKQIPFATAQALTAVAKDVVTAERQMMERELDRPTPFTLRSVRSKGATKARPVATVYVMNIAASYLEPFIVGGPHKLIGRGKTWLNPKDRSLLNRYGNFSAGTLARLRSRPDVFIGSVKTKEGKKLSGVWQRPKRAGAGRRTGRGRVPANTSGRLKLLIAFGDEMQVKQQLTWFETAEATIAKRFSQRMDESMRRALSTARK